MGIALHPLNLLRLLAFSLILFSSGMTVGWWLHLRWPPTKIVYGDVVEKPIVVIANPQLPELPSHATEPNSYADQLGFYQTLEEGRYDDALTIYQRHESSDSPLFTQLRNALQERVENWSKTGQHNLAALFLERFTDYYYQDISLLKLLALVYEEDQQLDKSIETYINARTYAYQPDQLNFLNKRIHNLAKQLYEHHVEKQSTEILMVLFQKLVLLEPDYTFYRFVLAKSYIAIADNDSAIRELEMLQFDPKYGHKTSQLLVGLRPSPLPDEPDEPVNRIPLSGRGGHYVVSAVTGSKYPVRLLIDTGATLTTLPKYILTELRKRELATRIAHIELQTANGIRTAPVYRLKAFQIGHHTLANLEVAELDLGSSSSDGLLGMNVLGKFNFFIDQNHQTLSLEPR
ncbi:hypothetical protein ACH42_07630 [Endozoicomonas sp. (ex Bugula neritina AB1)]|nr:hypothetical protein ACH42_07630 [Endozoicomonas sp. (ex Bugula neritina AB1)]